MVEQDKQTCVIVGSLSFTSALAKHTFPLMDFLFKRHIPVTQLNPNAKICCVKQDLLALVSSQPDQLLDWVGQVANSSILTIPSIIKVTALLAMGSKRPFLAVTHLLKFFFETR